MSISKRLRYEILNRDGFACVYCGADSKQLHVDHVMPTALGGTDDASNLVTSCQDCNLGKSSTAPNAEQVAAVDQKAVEWRASVSDAIASFMAEQAATDAAIEQFGVYWDSWTWTDRKGEKHNVAKGAGWRNSIRLMLERGMPLEALGQCVKIAMQADVDDEWSYFCGVVWRTLKRAQGEDV